eukprot:500334_1
MSVEPLHIDQVDNEEEKYMEITDNQADNEIECELFSTTKRMRSLKEIEIYLQHFVPQFTAAKSMTKAILFVIVPLFVNISFICDNFFGFDHSDSNPSTSTQSLQIITKITLYVEFVGLLIIFAVIITSYMLGNYNTTIDMIYYIKSWSTFRLFYKFRPSALYEYFSVFYGHHSHRQQRNLDNKHKKWETIVNELNREIATNNTQYIDMNEIISMRNTLQKVLIGSAENINYFPNNNILSPTHFRPTTSAKLKKFGSWVLLLLISAAFLTIGILSLVLKLTQFTYFTRSEVWELQFRQYLVLGGFCNQLWGMVNYQPIRLDTMYKFIYMEGIKCRYSRFVADNIAQLDAIIKYKLWEYHGWKGFMLALQMDWKMVYKIVFIDEMDILSMKQCLEWDHSHQKQNGFNHLNTEKMEFTTLLDDESVLESVMSSWMLIKPSKSDKLEDVSLTNFQQMAGYKSIEETSGNGSSFHVMISMMLKQFKAWIRENIDTIMDYIRLKDKWKPLHPYTKAQYALLRLKQKNRSRIRRQEKQKTVGQSYIFNGIVIFERIENLIQYIIPFVYILTLGFGIGALIIDHKGMGRAHCTETMDWNELLILYIVISITAIISMVMINKCKSRLKMLCPGIVIVLIIATCVDGVIMVSCFLHPNSDDHIDNFLFLWMFMISVFIFMVCILSTIIMLMIVHWDWILFIAVFAIFTVINVIVYFLYMLTGLITLTGFVMECVYIEMFYNRNQHCIDHNGFMNARFYDTVCAVMIVSTVWVIFVGMLHAWKSYSVCNDDWFGPGFAVTDGLPNKYGNAKYMNKWNVIMCISIVVFLYIHIAFVLLYYIDLKALNHLEENQKCDDIFKNINIVTICCYILPYCILIGYICCMNNNFIFWIAQLNVIRMTTLCCRDRIDDD